MEEDWLQNALHIDDRELFDIQLLDDVVGCMHNGSGEPKLSAEKRLTALKEHPDALERVGLILVSSQNQQTKYFASQILENVIKTRWKVLPAEQCEGIKKYIVDLIIKTYSDPTPADKGKSYRRKLNVILVQILMQDLQKNWRTFIGDIIVASRTNESLCQNTMVILKQLILRNHRKATHLKDFMRNEFGEVFQLCELVLMDNSQNAPLVIVTLNTLLLFLHWMPVRYIFETELILKLVNKFLAIPMFRNITLRCLTEIAGKNVQKYEEEFKKLFLLTMTQLKQMLPTTIDMKSAYANGTNYDQNFIQNTASFFCVFFKMHVKLIERTPDLRALLLDGFEYLVLISEVENREIFKICLKYWKDISGDLHRKIHTSRRGFYLPLLSKVRLLMISRMAKPPEEVLVKNEQGEVVTEYIQNADSSRVYRKMKKTLIFLTSLDFMDTIRIMAEKLHNQVNGTEWLCKNLSTLCWAIGSIGGEIWGWHGEDVKKFVFTVLKGLIKLQWNCKTDNDRRIIASNIMFIGGRYIKYLCWKILKTFTNWLFDFMHDTHDSIKVMACNTFLKLAQECSKQFLHKHAGEDRPFIEEILNFISTKTGDLQPQQKHTFYEAVGYMVGTQTNTNVQKDWIENVSRNPNQGHQEMKVTFYSTVHGLIDKRRRRKSQRHMRTHINMHWYMPWPMERHFIDYIDNELREEMPTKFTAKRKPFRRPVESQ